MPVANPLFHASRALYDAVEASENEWDAMVFGRPAPVLEPWRPSPGTDPTFTIEAEVRGIQVRFDVVVNRFALSKGLPRESFDIRILSPSLLSMENALLKIAGVGLPAPIPSSTELLGPVDLEDNEDLTSLNVPALPEAQAEKIVALLNESKEPVIAVLALAQRFCVRLRNNPVQNQTLRRLMVTLSDKLFTDKDDLMIEEVRQCFMSYSYALAIRLSKSDPEEWGAYHRAAMLVFDAMYTRDVYEEMEQLWLIVQAMGRRSREERMDHADITGVYEDEMSELGKFGLYMFFQQRRSKSKDDVLQLADQKLEDTVSAPIESPDEALLCVVCWSRFLPHNPPITFGDGRTVCRGCVQKRRRQLSRVEKLKDLSRVTSWELETDPTPLSEVFGSTADLTLGRIVEVVSSSSKPQDESSPVYFNKLGASLYAEGKYSQALDAFTNAIRLDPRAAVYFSNRSAVLGKLHRKAEALQDAREAVRLSGGKWAKAHYRVFECSQVMIPTKGMIIRAHTKATRPEEDGEDNRVDRTRDDDPMSVMSEDDYLLSWRKRFGTKVPTGDLEQWLKDSDTIVEALASLLRAYAMGERLENHFRRTLIMLLLTDAKMFDQFPESEDKVERIRRSSFTLKVARELFQSRLLRRCCTIESRDSNPAAFKDVASKLQGSEMDCTLCYSLLCQPTTLPCGHSFCRSCAIRAIDHSAAQGEAKCPMCRYSLKSFIDSLNDVAYQRARHQRVLDLGLEHIQVNAALDSIIRFLFPDEYATRMEQTMEEEVPIVVSSSPPIRNEQGLVVEADIPWILHETLLIPNTPLNFVLWEPADRLMIRRLAFVKSSAKKTSDGDAGDEPMDVVKGKFGICWESHTGTSKFGLIATISDLTGGADGGLFVFSSTGERFEVLKDEMRDGYHTARVRLLDQEEKGKVLTDAQLQEFLKEQDPAELASQLARFRVLRWEGASVELIAAELVNLWNKVKQSGAPWQGFVNEESATKLEALPFSIAAVLFFPDQLSYYLMYGKRTRNSFMERARLVLLYANPSGRQWGPGQDVHDHVDLYPELANMSIGDLV